MKKSISSLFFRLGLSSFFLLNSLSAWFAPDEFTEIVSGNAFTSAIASPATWLVLIGINDGLLFLLILTGKWRRFTAVWAFLWLLAVVYLTGFGSEFIMHVGIMALLAYYYFGFE